MLSSLKEAEALPEDVLPSAVHEEAVHLEDGRTLGVAEFGVRDGRAIFWFHGTPGARRQVPPQARRVAEQLGLRVIGIERPGIGDSTPHLYDSIGDWADDVEQIADHLGVDRFGLIGLSGGGPYVLACAHRLGDRAVAGVVLGGVAPTRGREAAAGGLVGLASPLEPLVGLLREPLGSLFSAGIRALHPVAEQMFSLYVRVAPERDREILSRDDMRGMFIDDLLLGSKKGFRAVISDAVLFFRPWGFSLREIDLPIRFFQGDRDPLVPFSHGAHQAAVVPGATLVYRPDEGHLGGLDAADEAIDFILSQWPNARRKKQ